MKKLPSIFYSIKVKFFLAFLCLFIPLFMLGIMTYKKGFDIINQEINNTFNTSVLSFYNMLESETYKIQSIKYQLLLNDELNYLVDSHPIMDSFDIYEKKINISYFIKSMKEISPLVEEIIVSIPQINISFSSIYGAQDLKSDYSTGENEISIKNDKIIYKTLYSRHGLNSEDEKNNFYVTFVFSNSEIIKNLKKYQNNESFFLILLNSDENFYLTNNKKDLFDLSKDDLIKLENNSEFYSQNKKFLSFYKNLGVSNFGLSLLVPYSYVEEKQNPYKLYFILYIVFGISVVLLFTCFFNRMINKPIQNLIKYILKVEKQNFKNIKPITTNKNDEFKYLYSTFNKMCVNIEKLINEVYEQQLLTEKANLKQLQSQINPHFLYNSFFNINLMAEYGDYQSIVSITEYLGKYYRYITRNKNEETSLYEEYQHTRNYCEIQKIRFAKHLTLRMDKLPESINNVIVPKLIIQPIVENAFNYGLKNEITQKLHIGIKVIDNIIYISVSDNGSDINEKLFLELNEKVNNKELNIENTALININKRLKLFFGPNYGLSFYKSEYGGLCVEIKIPKEGKNNV